MARWRRISRIAGISAGAAAAGVGAVITAERLAAHRLRLFPDPAADEPFGELRGREFAVLAPDGVPLHVEVNGPDDAPVTIIFCHGYALNQDSWHYQRRDLGGVARLVFWDQRGHGRSGRACRAAGHRRSDRRRPGRGHPVGDHGTLPGGPGRPFDGRHDDHGAGRPASGTIRLPGVRRRPHRHLRGRPERSGRPGARDAVPAADVLAARRAGPADRGRGRPAGRADRTWPESIERAGAGGHSVHGVRRSAGQHDPDRIP